MLLKQRSLCKKRKLALLRTGAIPKYISPMGAGFSAAFFGAGNNARQPLGAFMPCAFEGTASKRGSHSLKPQQNAKKAA